MRKRLVFFMVVLTMSALGLAPVQASHELQLRLQLPLNFVYAQFYRPLRRGRGQPG